MKQTLLLVAALVAGFVGGILGTLAIRVREQPRSEQIVRAHSFQLLGESGKVISSWGIDKDGNALLVFGSHWPVGSGGGPHQPGFGLEDPRGQRVAIGVLADSPFLFFRAPDGEKRMSMDLSIFEKPMLWMGDETGPRMSLGVEQSDTPGPLDRNWALDFGPNTARIGMFAERVEGKTYVRGLFSVNRDRVLYPYPYEQPK